MHSIFCAPAQFPISHQISPGQNQTGLIIFMLYKCPSRSSNKGQPAASSPGFKFGVPAQCIPMCYCASITSKICSNTLHCTTDYNKSKISQWRLLNSSKIYLLLRILKSFFSQISPVKLEPLAFLNCHVNKSLNNIFLPKSTYNSSNTPFPNLFSCVSTIQ